MKVVNRLILVILMVGSTLYGMSQYQGLQIGAGIQWDQYFNHYTEKYSSYKFQGLENFSYGIRLGYQTKGKLGFYSGLYYAYKGYKVDYNWVGSSGIIDPAIPKETTRKSNYLEIPLEISYRFMANKKIDLKVITGGVTSILLSEKESSVMGDDTEKETDFFGGTFEDYAAAPVMLQWRLGLQGQYHISKVLVVSLYPYLSKSLVSLNDKMLQNSPWGVGGLFSVSYRFKK